MFDERTDWTALPIDDLCACESALTFADPDGVRFLLPAFLLAQLDDKLPAGILYNLIFNSDQSYHFSALSPSQRTAVREFLLVLKDDPNYEIERSDIERSLETFWKE